MPNRGPGPKAGGSGVASKFSNSAFTPVQGNQIGTAFKRFFTERESPFPVYTTARQVRLARLVWAGKLIIRMVKQLWQTNPVWWKGPSKHFRALLLLAASLIIYAL